MQMARVHRLSNRVFSDVVGQERHRGLLLPASFSIITSWTEGRHPPVDGCDADCRAADFVCLGIEERQRLMARSDLILTLVKAGSRGDHLLFRKAVEAMIVEEQAKQHHLLAQKLTEELRSNSSLNSNGPVVLGDRLTNLLLDVTPHLTLDDLILPPSVDATCREIIEEHNRADLLRSYNLEPRSRILLQGPPGNGKTSLAEALASSLMATFLVVRYEGVIGTYLGETAVRLKRVFEFASTRRCVLFFDEFDTLGKERGDVHDTGEIKRVVSSLLLQIDALPSHVVVITATNHAELLDRAVWRRFQVHMTLPKPKREDVLAWLSRFEKRFGHPLGLSNNTLADKLKGASYADMEILADAIQRRYVLSLPDAKPEAIVRTCVEQWQERRLAPNGD
jgi:AAA+ superfamily predicted ATPase